MKNILNENRVFVIVWAATGAAPEKYGSHEKRRTYFYFSRYYNDVKIKCGYVYKFLTI